MMCNFEISKNFMEFFFHDDLMDEKSCYQNGFLHRPARPRERKQLTDSHSLTSEESISRVGRKFSQSIFFRKWDTNVVNCVKKSRKMEKKDTLASPQLSECLPEKIGSKSVKFQQTRILRNCRFVSGIFKRVKLRNTPTI